MTELEVFYFENSNKLLTELFNYLQDHSSLKIKLEYYESYAWEMRCSKQNSASIRVTIKGYTSASICIHSYMCGERPKPYFLALWKYNGNHEFYEEDMNEEQCKNYDYILDKINEFYGLHSSKTRYEQLTLF